MSCLILRNSLNLCKLSKSMSGLVFYSYFLFSFYSNLNTYLRVFSYLSDPPGPPINLKASRIGEKFIEIDWHPPKYNGGTPITNYIIKKSEGKPDNWVKVATVSSYENYCRATKLTEGTNYFFQVIAENKVGVSEPCESKPLATIKGASKFLIIFDIHILFMSLFLIFFVVY